MALVLHAAANNFRTFEALIAAKYGASDVKVQHDTDKKSTFGKIPSLDCGGGKNLTGCHAIAKFLAKNALSAASTCQTSSAEILQWFDLVDNDLVPNSLAWMLPCVSALPHTKHADEAKTETLRLLTVLNDFLVSRTFLVGQRISLADVAVCCALIPLYQNVLEPENREKLTHLTRWFETCVNQPHFKAVLGEIHMCSKASHFDQKKFEEFHRGSASTVSKHEKPAAKKEEKKEAAKPKEKKEKPKAAEPEEEMDEADAALAQEPKQNDPFAAMPKGTFNLEEFKRVYSNEDTLAKALPYFWQHFDAENFSIWRCDYKYPEELTLCFMSCNLISGMFQRLDKLRKNAFASMCLFGSDNNSTISGIWVWKGHQLAFELSDDWKVDYESYNWKKLEAKAPETQKMVEEYFAWEGEFGGQKFNQGKIFK